MHATFSTTIAVDLIHIVAINMSNSWYNRSDKLWARLAYVSPLNCRNLIKSFYCHAITFARATAVTINSAGGGWWDVTHNPQPHRTLRCGGRVDWFFAPWRHDESSMRVMVKHGADIGTGACSFVLSPVLEGEGGEDSYGSSLYGNGSNFAAH